MGVGGLHQAPAALPPGSNRYSERVKGKSASCLMNVTPLCKWRSRVEAHLIFLLTCGWLGWGSGSVRSPSFFPEQETGWITEAVENISCCVRNRNKSFPCEARPVENTLLTYLRHTQRVLQSIRHTVLLPYNYEPTVYTHIWFGNSVIGHFFFISFLFSFYWFLISQNGRWLVHKVLESIQ